jgi:hypothetical protein
VLRVGMRNRRRVVPPTEGTRYRPPPGTVKPIPRGNPVRMGTP